jgi:radical SAM enzyme (TIGR01210 family)
MKINLKFFYIEKVFRKKRMVLFLPGGGCAWAKKSGGCYMCGFNFKLKKLTKWKTPSSGLLLALFWISNLYSKFVKPQSLVIYNGGSFLNDNEIPLKIQEEICRQIARHPTIEELFVESRPEFITDEKIRRLKHLVGKKKLKVGIGLECASDDIRERCIHKGFQGKDYEKAVEILKKNGVRVLTYVFLKPIFLSEREAIEEAVRTIEYAFRNGSDEVALEAAFIQKGTLMERLYRRGKYRPPWLWSIIKIVRETHHLGPVYIGSFTDEPPPIDIPRNCKKCSSMVSSLIQKYRETGDISIFTDAHCQCEKEWQKELEKQ